MKNIPLPDLYYLENPDLKQLFVFITIEQPKLIRNIRV